MQILSKLKKIPVSQRIHTGTTSCKVLIRPVPPKPTWSLQNVTWSLWMNLGGTGRLTPLIILFALYWRYVPETQTSWTYSLPLFVRPLLIDVLHQETQVTTHVLNARAALMKICLWRIPRHQNDVNMTSGVRRGYPEAWMETLKTPAIRCTVRVFFKSTVQAFHTCESCPHGWNSRSLPGGLTAPTMKTWEGDKGDVGGI